MLLLNLMFAIALRARRRHRFDFTKRAAYYLIDAYEVVNNLKSEQIVHLNKSTILPTQRIRATSALHSLPLGAGAIAPCRKTTGTHLRPRITV